MNKSVDYITLSNKKNIKRNFLKFTLIIVSVAFVFQNKILYSTEKLINGFITVEQGTYEGDTSWGKLTGEGTFKFNTGDIYQGDFSNNNISGNGTYQFSSGDYYTGEWSNGLMNGNGTLTLNGIGVYSGGFADSKRSGKGDFIWDN